MDDNIINQKQKKTGSVKSKKDEVSELKDQMLDLENQLKRAVADYRNLERRVEEARRETIRYANKELVTNLLPAFDTLFLAGKYTTDESVRLTIIRILDILRENGIEKIATENVKYNVETMEAVEVVAGGSSVSLGQENEVLEEIRPGFMINGNLIRAAQVKVEKGSV